MPDALLWRRSLAGEGEAFGLLFDRHRDRVFWHACRLAETRQDGEDILASAFLELWRRRQDVRLHDGSVLPWLLVTTTNLGRNAARARRRHRAFLDRLPHSEEHLDSAQATLEAGPMGVDPRLRSGLKALKDTDAQLFVLVALEDYPVAVAAELLGLTLPAAKTRLQRARAALRERWNAGQPSPSTLKEST